MASPDKKDKKLKEEASKAPVEEQAVAGALADPAFVLQAVMQLLSTRVAPTIASSSGAPGFSAFFLDFRHLPVRLLPIH